MPPFNTVAGYGGFVQQPDGSLLIDDENSQTAVSGVFIDAQGDIGAATYLPSSPNFPGVPIGNAILAELRVMSEILNYALLGDKAIDLRFERAQALFGFMAPTGTA